MTQPAVEKKSRKKVLLVALLSVVLLATAWVALFLVNFDLNNYRQQMEEQLASMLSLPVKIGELRYNIRDTSLALQIDGLQIGGNNSTLQVEAPSILIKLKWRGLLERDLQFAKISLTRPSIHIRPANNIQQEDGPAAKDTNPLAIDQKLLNNITVDALEVFDGVINIETTGFVEPLDISGLDLELSGIHLGQLAQVIAKGDFNIPGQGGKMPWQLLGEASLELAEDGSLKPSYNLDLNVKTLELGSLKAFFPEQLAGASINGTSTLQLHLEGPAGDLDFQAGLTSTGITLLPNASYPEPIRINNLLVNGQLQTSGERSEIRGFSLQVDQSRVAGHLSWADPEQPLSTTITLFNGNLSAKQIKQWLPTDSKVSQIIRRNLKAQGAVKIEHAEFKLTVERESQQKNWRIDAIKGELIDLAWGSEDTPTAEIASLPFDFADNQWQITAGRALLGSQQLNIAGTGGYGHEGGFLTALSLTGVIVPDKLFKDLQINEPPVSISGQVAIDARLEGPFNQLSLDLQGDLSQLNISHPDGMVLTPESDDKLTLHGTLSPQKISLDHGSIKWALAKGHLSGSYLTEDPDSLAIDALLTIDDLGRLAETLPVLTKMKLHGQADLAISQKGLLTESRPEMTLTLRDAGLRATKYIADINNINGRVQVTLDGLKAEKLQVHLGESPLTVKARIEDFTKPRLELDVKAPAVRAKDIVFYSDTAMIRDVDGRLEIDRNGLSFDPVDVRLDGGTDASVSGTISFHAPFPVKLDITSDFVLISEIVGLWSDRQQPDRKQAETAQVEAKTKKPKTSIIINARAGSGDLYGMSFHDASGVIVPSRERLIIHPLDFSVGEGYCNAQVITDFSRQGSPLLRVSGHAEDVDALEVYGELLNQKSIMRGKLRGDFYLTGEIGSNYLPSSYGNFNVEVQDGVLHRFQVLSKIFSLLNVSQIFALKLPDMDLEGMPFDTLSANLVLNKGVLSSNDLKISSEAMNQDYSGQLDLVKKEIDLEVAVHPLGTVDKILSRIPIAGWLLTGEDKAFLTAHFSVTGPVDEANVDIAPLDTISDQTIGLLKRTLGLPFKLAEDPQILWGGDGSKQ
jgi:hypothetical protein